jgi:hypothetical protein
MKRSLPCYYSEYSIIYDRRGDVLLVHYGPRYPLWHLKSLQTVISKSHFVRLSGAHHFSILVRIDAPSTHMKSKEKWI